MAKKTSPKKITAEQRAALAPAFKRIEAAQRSLDRALAKLGIDPEALENETFACSRCSCVDFVSKGAGIRCARPTCGHHHAYHVR